MGSFIYNIGLRLFAFLFPIAGYFNAKIRLGVQGRKGLKERLQMFKNGLPKHTKIAWFHAASLGEFEQGKPVIEEFKGRFPDYAIVLTFFSPSGYEVRKNYGGADFICYLPLDTPGNSQWFVEILNPQIAFFVKYEFWYNILEALHRQGTVILSFSTIFRRDQLFFKPYGGFYSKLLSYFHAIFVQNKASIELLNGIGIQQCYIAGDTRFDRVYSIATQSEERREIADFFTDTPVLIAGSIWPQDMAILIPVLNRCKGRVKVIFAPHEIKKEQIKNWRSALQGASVQYSELETANLKEMDYLFIDNIGILSSLYRYGQMAYIGGAFGVGLHNILEAATFGLPLVFGDRSYGRFQEAVDLVARGGAITVADADQLQQTMESWLTNAQATHAQGAINAQYVRENLGASKTIMDRVERLLVTPLSK
ncbi:3-deoxy-D-manno-octulosonic-acid transferase [Dyadobacter jejuensis]|uniref:3-deoxy-D-manno-octulosonic acid transferase n=1 Tax=Dyadobacter jejuensis TaxID=1082580 RepID=A0A316AQ34_9BACT|nr:glycosyltransferase N-terminal domain-containing protein [Dyadobacter jejuensis]PWJ59591.1 3-deoxy-D-manno-octulosonic-acid transferase [Dyadobacter jejuensis]